MSDVAAVVFDVDGVLVPPWRFRDHLTRHHEITPEMTAPFFQGPFRDCVVGRGDLLDVLPQFLEKWGWSDTPRAFVDLWLRVEHDLDPGVLEVVDELRERGTPCFAASVQERQRADYLRREMGLGACLDGLFFSCDLGVRKPEPAFFHAIVERLPLRPGQLLFFDDHEGNVEGARAAGWRAEPFTSVARLRADLARHTS